MSLHRLSPSGPPLGAGGEYLLATQRIDPLLNAEQTFELNFFIPSEVNTLVFRWGAQYGGVLGEASTSSLTVTFASTGLVDTVWTNEQDRQVDTPEAEHPVNGQLFLPTASLTLDPDGSVTLEITVTPGNLDVLNPSFFECYVLGCFQ